MPCTLPDKLLGTYSARFVLVGQTALWFYAMNSGAGAKLICGYMQKEQSLFPFTHSIGFGAEEEAICECWIYLWLWFAKAIGCGLAFFDAKNEEPDRANNWHEGDENPSTTFANVVHAANA